MTIFVVLIVAILGPLLARFAGVFAYIAVWVVSLPMIAVWFLFRCFFPKKTNAKAIMQKKMGVS